MSDVSIVWFRRDLRLADNPALDAARRRGGPIVPVFVWAPDEDGVWPPGAASRWWLHHSLASLASDLEKAGSRLVLRRGASGAALLELATATGASAIYWNRLYEPSTIARDRSVKSALRSSGFEAGSFNASLLFEPWDIRARSGTPFQVFTPFWRACLDAPYRADPLPAPRAIPAPASWPDSVPLESLALLPRIDWASGLREAWSPGATGAESLLARFLDGPIAAYDNDRDRPDLDGGARLSPHLHFGELGPRQVRFAVERAGKSGEPFLRQLGWREFAHHLLFHFPHTPEAPLRTEFERFPWAADPAGLQAWQRGRTGFPIVDAGMRQLWKTGWMHNRVRMIAASFLVKDLRVHWLEGARWFWDTLVDADLANNTLGWQWTAGCGADAAPYFRIFNPSLQAAKFDPEGAYVRRWGGNSGLRRIDPIVDHDAARRQALEALSFMKAGVRT